MIFPRLTLVPAPPLEDEVYSVNKAAQWVNAGTGSLVKLLASKYLSDLRVSQLMALRSAPFVNGSRTIPLLQVAVAAREDPRVTWRTHVGDSPNLSDEEWCNAVRGDWRGINAHEINKIGYLLIGMGGVVTGVLKITGIDENSSPSRVRFQGQALGRLRSDLATGLQTKDASASKPEKQLVQTVLGQRFEPRAGGSFIWL